MWHWVCFFALFLMSACSSFPMRYVWQAGRGQWSLFWRERPIHAVLEDPRVHDDIKQALAWVPELKQFASERGLIATRHYETYVQLDHSFVVWVVSACQPFAFLAKEWTFPFLGAFPYLGWFDSKDAHAYAKQLEQEGWEVDVRGVTAYSTLNWFRDPILSSMIDSSSSLREAELAHVLFHESVHATVSFPNETTWNENLADFVADRLLEMYLDTKGKRTLKKAYFEIQKIHADWRQLLHSSYQELDALYQNKQESQTFKQERKQEIYDSLQKKFPKVPRMNNARLMQFRVYHRLEGVFKRLWQEEGEDIKSLLTRVRQMSRLEREQWSKQEEKLF